MATLDIGRTFSRMSSLVGSSFASVGVFVLGVHVVTTGLQFFINRQMIGAMAGIAPTPGNPLAGLAVFSSGWYWASLVIAMALGGFSMAGGIGGMLRIARGEATSVADCVAIGAGKLLPVLGFSILWGLAIGLGSMLLVVPGLILLTMWSAGLPALVAGDTGVFGAFGRSRALTRGSRWRIFAVLLIMLIVIYVVMFVVLGAVGFSMMPKPGTPVNATMLAASSPLVMLGSMVVGTLSVLVIDALLVSIYTELDDGSGGRLANVFS